MGHHAQTRAKLEAFRTIVEVHCFGTEELNAPPKVLADLVESIVGAAFIDCGQDLATTWKAGPPRMAVTSRALPAVAATATRVQRWLAGQDPRLASAGAAACPSTAIRRMQRKLSS